MNVIEYVTEEVSRQGHDIHQPEGIIRVSWMLSAWYAALEGFDHFDICIQFIEAWGKLIERDKNCMGFRRVGVRVGPQKCPRPSEVRPRLETLLSKEKEMTPIEFYKEFELIHPFCDGNGRTGKILLNWKNGTLLDPIFPPADLFGYPIRNP